MCKKSCDFPALFISYLGGELQGTWGDRDRQNYKITTKNCHTCKALPRLYAEVCCQEQTRWCLAKNYTIITLQLITVNETLKGKAKVRL